MRLPPLDARDRNQKARAILIAGKDLEKLSIQVSVREVDAVNWVPGGELVLYARNEKWFRESLAEANRPNGAESSRRLQPNISHAVALLTDSVQFRTHRLQPAQNLARLHRDSAQQHNRQG
jgi:hypothetical protein